MRNEISGVWLNLNDVCNLNCQWCYNKSSLNNGTNMKVELAESIIDLMNECGAKKYSLIGGEPSLYKHLDRIIKKIHSHGSSSTLLTNGIKLTNYDFCSSLKNAGLSGVNVSIKAINGNDMKSLTGYDDVDYLRTVVHNLRSLELASSASVVISKYTCQHLSEIVHYLKDIGFDNIILSFCLPVFCGDMSNYMLENESLEDSILVIKTFFEKYEEIQSSLNENLSGCGPLPLCLYPKDILKKMVERKQLNNGCIILSRRGVVFTPNGEVTICNHLQDFTIGRYGDDFVDKKSFFEFWNSIKVQDALDKMTQLPKEECLMCDKLKFCGGSCPLRWFQYSMADLEEKMRKEGIL